MAHTDPHRSSEAAEHRPYELVASDLHALIEANPISGDRLQIARVLQGSGVKMVRLSLADGQVMREHSTNAPLIVQVLDGLIAFRIAGEELELPTGAVLYVDPEELHEVEALRDSHVLLTLCA